LSFDLRIQGYDRDQQGVFYQRLLERVRGLPGVTAASFSSPMPLGPRLTSTPVAAEGPNDHDVNVQASFAAIWPEYFAAIGAPLLRGREFTTHDHAGSVPVAIVNATLARRLWPDQDPIGKRLRFPDGRGQYLEVVGVARDGKYHDLTEAPRGFLYVPERQRTPLSDITLLVRASGDPRPLIPELERSIHALDPNLPLFQVVTLDQALRDRLDQERGASAVLGVFGVLALLLAALGLYGVMSYTVTRRRNEIGIRMALGAQPESVMRLVLIHVALITLVGLLVGIAGAVGTGRFINSLLFNLATHDRTMIAITALTLVLAAAIAGYLPARRASRIDPMTALREE
jgi:putative ABC transport system permease protein